MDNIMQPFTQSPANTSAEAVSGTTSSGLFQKRWFCVGLYPNGRTIKQDAETPVNFLDVMNRSVISWVDFISNDPSKDIPTVAAQMGFSKALISSIFEESYLKYQDFDKEMWLQIPAIQVRGVNVADYPLYLLMRKNVVFSIHVSMVDKRFIRLRRYSDNILRRIPMNVPSEDKLTLLMSRIIDANNDSNFRHLRAIEEQSDDLNKTLMNSKTDRSAIAPKIYEMKHALITYMNALWDSVDVLHTLRYGDADLITNEENLLQIITVMTDEVKSQIGLAEHMSEVLASGLEVMQSIYNNQLQVLNNRIALVMTYLTIIGTAVLVPNTIATVMSSSSFNLDSGDLWWYLILLIGSTLVATAGVWWWLKKIGLLPKKVD